VNRDWKRIKTVDAMGIVPDVFVGYALTSLHFDSSPLFIMFPVPILLPYFF
jgi:hypothetical protein